MQQSDPADSASAEHIIAGFRYQLLHSVAAWLTLRSSAELWLEISEDYSTIDEFGQTDVQVKGSQAQAGPQKFSLRSTAVIENLNRYWTRHTSGKPSKLVFIARGGAAKEKGFEFPEGVPGLQYWRKAANDAPVEPIKRALIEVMGDSELGKWLKSSPSDLEIRDRLLTRVRWELEALPADLLTAQLRDQVSGALMERGLPVSGANQLLRILVEFAFERASSAQADNRKLRSVDLATEIEAWATNAGLLSLGQIAALTPADPNSVLVSEFDSVPDSVCRRDATVLGILQKNLGETVLWLHGSSGTGKSTLAGLLAGQLGGQWLVLDLRQLNTDLPGALAAWRELIRAITQGSDLRGVIINDFTFDGSSPLWGRLSALVQTVGGNGGKIIVTSSQIAAPARLLSMGSSPSVAFQAPYFTQAEVADFIAAQLPLPDAPSTQWAAMIWITASGGHPTLVAAKIASLRARGWPSAALMEDISSVSEATELTRTDARRVLLRDLAVLDADSARVSGELLRRIASVFERVDSGLAHRLITSDPLLPAGGDALAVLKGGWLEVLPDGDLRISPLLSDIVGDLPAGVIKNWRKVAAEYWLESKTLDRKTLPLCFWNAYLGEHSGVLVALCQVLMTLSEDKIAGAAPVLSPILALRKDGSVYPSNPFVAINIRILQFEVANVMEESEAAGEIAIRLLQEVADFEHVPSRTLLTAYVIQKILLAPNCTIGFALRIKLCMDLQGAFVEADKLTELSFSKPSGLILAEMPGVDLPSFMFSTSIQHVHSSNDFLDFIQALNDVPKHNRDAMLGAMNQFYAPSIIVGSGWSQDQLSGQDMNGALAAYGEAETICRSWGIQSLLVEFVVARSVIVDECLNQKPESIQILDAGLEEFGEVPALIRQKAKVLSHMGEDADAAALMLAIEDQVGAEEFDRALALRDGAVSLAKAERLEDALRFFRKAEQAIRRTVDQKPLLAGLLVEQSLTSWKLQRKAEALGAIGDALAILDTFDTGSSAQAERSHRAARLLISCYLNNSTDRPGSTITIGEASSLEGQAAPIEGVELKPISDHWRLIVAVEALMDLPPVEAKRAENLGYDRSIYAVEALLLTAKFQSSLSRLDVDETLILGRQLTAAMFRQLAIGDRAARISQAEILALNPDVIPDDANGDEVIARIVVDIAIMAQSLDRLTPSFIEGLEQKTRKILGSRPIFSEVILGLKSPLSDNTSGSAVVAAAQYLTAPPSSVQRSARSRLMGDICLLMQPSMSHYAPPYSEYLLERIREGWSWVLGHQRFQLTNPALHVPSIQEALQSDDGSLIKRAAEILLAVSAALPNALSAQWLTFLSMSKQK